MKRNNVKAKNTVGVALIYLLLLGVLNLLTFLIFKKRNEVFWLSYAFVTLAFAVQIVSMLLAFKTADVETVFFGIPLVSFSVYYLSAEIVIGALFMIFQVAPLALALVVQALLLAAFLIIAIVSLMARDTVQQIGENVKENVFSLKSVLADVEAIRGSCADPDLKETIRKLSETIKYSDPMTNEAVAPIEETIREKISELRACTTDGRLSDAKLRCGELEELYAERNRTLALLK